MLVAGHVMTADEMERLIFSGDATEIASTNCAQCGAPPRPGMVLCATCYAKSERHL